MNKNATFFSANFHYFFPGINIFGRNNKKKILNNEKSGRKIQILLKLVKKIDIEIFFLNWHKMERNSSVFFYFFSVVATVYWEKKSTMGVYTEKDTRTHTQKKWNILFFTMIRVFNSTYNEALKKELNFNGISHLSSNQKIYKVIIYLIKICNKNHEKNWGRK